MVLFMRNAPFSTNDRSIVSFELKWPVRRLFKLIKHSKWGSAIEDVPGLKRPRSIKFGDYSIQVLKPIRKANKVNTKPLMQHYLDGLATLKDIEEGTTKISFIRSCNEVDSMYEGCPTFNELFRKMCHYGELYAGVEETSDMRKIISVLCKLENCSPSSNVTALKAKLRDALEKEYNKQRASASTCPQD
jgi:hypothetical protein